MVKTINFKYYLSMMFISSYLVFIAILTLRAIPSIPLEDEQIGNLFKRDIDESQVMKTEDKEKYVSKSDFLSNISNSGFSFVHVAWGAIASAFRSFYKISNDDLVTLSAIDFEDFNSIKSGVTDVSGLSFLIVILAIFLFIAVFVNIIGCPIFLCINCCINTHYKTINYKKGKILCGKIYFGIFSFLLTFVPLFCLLGYKSINNSVDLITQSGKTLVYDFDKFINDTTYVLQNKTADIIIDNIHVEVVDPVIDDVDNKIIKNATKIYDETFDIINNIISALVESKDIITNDVDGGYKLVKDIYDLSDDFEKNYPKIKLAATFINSDISKEIKDKAEEINKTLESVYDEIENSQSKISEVNKTLTDINISELFEETKNMINDGLEMIDSITSSLSDIDLSSVSDTLNDVYDVVDDVEDTKKKTDDYHIDLIYLGFFLFVTLFSIIVIIFALFKKAYMGVKISLIACIPCGFIFWILAILFLLVSVLISQTCKNAYDFDTDTINTIAKNLELNDNKDEDFIPYHLKFSTFSNVLKSCAINKNDSISIWTVLDGEEYEDFFQTICGVIEDNISSDDIPFSVNCTTVTGKADIVHGFIESIDISGKVDEEFGKINVNEFLGDIKGIDEGSIPEKIDITEINTENLQAQFEETKNNINVYCDDPRSKTWSKDEPGCQDEKKEEFFSRMDRLEENVEKLKKRVNETGEELNGILERVKTVKVELNEFVGNIENESNGIIDYWIDKLKDNDYLFGIFDKLFDEIFNDITQCKTWSQDAWIISNSVCHGIPNGTDVIWWSSVIIAFLLTFNMCGGIHLMTYAAASRENNGIDDDYNKKDKEDIYLSDSHMNKLKECAKSIDGSSNDNLAQDNVLKSNVMDDMNNISKYNAELDDGDADIQREELNEELQGAVKRHSMSVPSKELSDLLENGGVKSNYVRSQNFNTDSDEEEIVIEEEEEEKEENEKEKEEKEEEENEEKNRLGNEKKRDVALTNEEIDKQFEEILNSNFFDDNTNEKNFVENNAYEGDNNGYEDNDDDYK